MWEEQFKGINQAIAEGNTLKVVRTENRKEFYISIKDREGLILQSVEIPNLRQGLFLISKNYLNGTGEIESPELEKYGLGEQELEKLILAGGILSAEKDSIEPIAVCFRKDPEKRGGSIATNSFGEGYDSWCWQFKPEIGAM